MLSHSRRILLLMRNRLHFPSIGSDAPPSPLGIENGQIRENSENQGTPLQPF